MIADNLAELYVVICQTVNGEDKGKSQTEHFGRCMTHSERSLIKGSALLWRITLSLC